MFILSSVEVIDTVIKVYYRPLSEIQALNDVFLIK